MPDLRFVFPRSIKISHGVHKTEEKLTFFGYNFNEKDTAPMKQVLLKSVLIIFTNPS